MGDLQIRGLSDRTLTFVWTEFGRRPHGNRSSGTDHGAGGIASAMARHPGGRHHPGRRRAAALPGGQVIALGLAMAALLGHPPPPVAVGIGLSEYRVAVPAMRRAR